MPKGEKLSVPLQKPVGVRDLGEKGSTNVTSRVENRYPVRLSTSRVLRDAKGNKTCVPEIEIAKVCPKTQTRSGFNPAGPVPCYGVGGAFREAEKTSRDGLTGLNSFWNSWLSSI